MRVMEWILIAILGDRPPEMGAPLHHMLPLQLRPLADTVGTVRRRLTIATIRAKVFMVACDC